MSTLPQILINGLIAVVALALYIFFWWAVRELPMWFKYLVRFGLTVLLVLPVVLVWLSMSEMPEMVGSAPPADMSDGSETKTAKKTRRRRERPKTYSKNGSPAPESEATSEEKTITLDYAPGPAAANGGDSHSPTGGGVPRNGGPPPAGAVPEAMAPPTEETSPPPTATPAPPAPGAPAGGLTPRSVVIPDSEEAEKKDWSIVPVFYGTDRARKTGPKRLTYDWERGRRLELGRALVTVPAAHVVPMVERPWALTIPYFEITLYEEAEDPKRHFTMKELKALTRDEFLSLVRERLGGSQRFKDHALIFVHGYKTKFDNAVYRTAQIAYDLKFDGAPFLYSWPSGGTYQGYTYDRESAGQAERYLRDFLKLVSDDTGAKKLSVIAHSMGNQVLLRVLQDLNRSVPADVKISQLILAAPDVDRDNFVNIVESIKDIAEGITLYAAANDAALQISRSVNGGVARAGDVPYGEGPIIIKGIDTIDATATSMDSLGINHAGYAENNALLSDIRDLISTGVRPPDQRQPHLQRIVTERGAYWKYPEKIE